MADVDTRILFKEYTCPHCRKRFEVDVANYYAEFEIDDPERIMARKRTVTGPQSGDLTICPWCVEILRFPVHRRMSKLQVVRTVTLGSFPDFIQRLLFQRIAELSRDNYLASLPRDDGALV